MVFSRVKCEILDRKIYISLNCYITITKMLKKDETKILKLLLNDMTKQWTIREISRALHQNYFQTHRTITALEKTKQISLTPIGKSKIVGLDFTQHNLNYTIAEMERERDITKNKNIFLIKKQLLHLNKQFVCLLFGGQVKKQKRESDIDLLFVIPNEISYEVFEREVRLHLSPYNCDINIVTQTGLLEMWSNPKKLTVGNELFKNHVVLYGAEHFVNLLRYHYVGQ